MGDIGDDYAHHTRSCFLFRLLVRAMIQFVFLTPKPPMIPAPPKPEPFIGAIFGSNALCLLLHLFCRAPAAGEATRGYLHGGLAIDFIGQKGPTSKLLLIFLDLVVMALQLVHLSAHVARSRLNESLTSTAAASALHAITQDLESEERGVRRSAEVLRLDAQATVELQSLNRLGNATTLPDADGEESDEGDSVLASTASPTDDFIFDAFKNGQIVLADLNPLRTVKEMVIRFHKAPPQVRRNAYHAHLAGSMMGLRLATGRTLGS